MIPIDGKPAPGARVMTSLATLPGHSHDLEVRANLYQFDLFRFSNPFAGQTHKHICITLKFVECLDLAIFSHSRQTIRKISSHSARWLGGTKGLCNFVACWTFKRSKLRLKGTKAFVIVASTCNLYLRPISIIAFQSQPIRVLNLADVWEKNAWRMGKT